MKSNRVCEKMLMLDLCAGLGGASAAFKEHGWTVESVEIEPKFCPTYCCDIRTFHYDKKPYLVWGSPPCTEFSKLNMPWYENFVPDMSILESVIRIISECKPIYWVIENVRGGVPYFKKYLGRPRQICGSRFLWGNFPLFGFDKSECYGKEKLFPSPDRSALRSKIPQTISNGLYRAITEQTSLTDWDEY